MNVDLKAMKIDHKIFCPQCGKMVWLFFEKALKISFFAWDRCLGKNGSFDLLGWLNECRDPFLIVIILMWTSRQWKYPFVCFWLFSESVFPVVFNHETLFFENGVVWCCDCSTMKWSSLPRCLMLLPSWRQNRHCLFENMSLF